MLAIPVLVPRPANLLELLEDIFHICHLVERLDRVGPPWPTFQIPLLLDPTVDVRNVLDRLPPHKDVLLLAEILVK